MHVVFERNGVKPFESMGDIFNKHSDNIQFASSAFIAGLGLFFLLQALYGLR